MISYFGLLDRVLEDRDLTQDEFEALHFLAAEWGISQEVASDLHRHYLDNLRRLALADGIVTASERNDIEIVAELLGVPLDLVPPAQPARSISVVPANPSRLLVGQTVCFTGESVCTIDSEPLDRATQEMLATRAGLIVKSGVSSKLDILVLADPDSMSGKARRARKLGVRRIAEPVFWRQIGLEID